jgi:cytoskeleton protein RodZ
MQSVGKMLRCEREKQNRSLSALATETCITSRYLQAIEEDNLKVLPGEFFYKNFVKQYANALRMDYSVLEKELARILPGEDIDPLPALSASYQIAKAEGRITRFPRNKARWVLALLAVVMVGCSGIYALWQKVQRANDPVEIAQATVTHQPPVEEPAVVKAAPAPVATVPSEQKIEPTIEPKSDPKIEPKNEIKNESKPDASRVSIDVAAKEKTWVSLSSDGRTIFRGILDRSETKLLEGLENARLTTGNAAGIDVRWNGKPIGPLGARGQVRVVLFTPENFQILAPRKM